jgi:hypothetical protein
LPRPSAIARVTAESIRFVKLMSKALTPSASNDVT